MRILIIGRPDALLHELANLLGGHGAIVEACDEVADVFARPAAARRPDLLLCPLGQDLAAAVLAVERSGVPVPIVAYGRRDACLDSTSAIGLGASGTLKLPATPRQVALLLRRAGPSRTARPLVAHDPAMLALLRRIELVASSNATVLITGESGSGKELVAAHLHGTSGRLGRFVAVNCAAVPDSMLECELFGHEAGAFPGATSRHLGKFESADGGTLLLDEIGEMGLRMQAMLLRAVQEREIDRVGGSRTVPVDVRIVATTNRDLKDEVRHGRFRADLFFRLNVVMVEVPALRRRPGDIAPLAEQFACCFAAASGRPARTISPDALDVLQRHSWPGNVRELENVIQRAVLIETEAEIGVGTIEIDASGTTRDEQAALPNKSTHAAVTRTDAVQVDWVGDVRTAGRTIEAVEKDMILDTLQQNLGNRAKTASVLGISTRTLRNKLHEYERGGTRIPRPVVVALA